MSNVDSLLAKIDAYIPSWSYFAIEKRGQYWFVSIKIDSKYTKEFVFETYDTHLYNCLNTSYKMLQNWANREEDIKEFSDEI